MYDLEIIIFFISIGMTCYFLFKWYNRLANVFKPKKKKLNNLILGFLPLVCFLIIYITLKNYASFDVVDSAFYIIFYLFLGFVWIFIGIKLLFYYFDMSIIDDVLNNGNKAALFTISGGVIGLTLIYSGANIGDGPGFWCVIVAGGIGFLIWIALIKLLNRFTKILERIFISRDIACGIRFGSFLIATGIILARASGGDWVDFNTTIIDFADGWVALPIWFLYLFIELIYKNRIKNGHLYGSIILSIFIGIFFIALAILSLMYIVPPLPENPIYNVIMNNVLGVFI